MSNTDVNSKRSWGEVLTLAAIVVAVGLLVWSGRRAGQQPVDEAIPLPPIMVEGWLNTERVLSRDDLLGKLVVVDCWFVNCPPCRASMPELASIYEKYHPLGVEFIGLTPDTAAQLPEVREFIGNIPGFDWPVGYGAAPTLDALGVRLFPTVLVFGPGGMTIWSANRLDGLPAALDKALAMR